MIVEVIVPSTRSSSAPVTVTVCGVSQFAGVKVTLAGTVASPVSSDVIVRTTSDVGCASSTTVNMSVVPDSSTSVAASVSSIVNPGVSSSDVSTETVWSATLSKSSSELASIIEITVDEVTVPSIMSSSIPVTVTVCAVSQFEGVNVNVLVVVASDVSFDATDITTSEVG